MADSMWHSVALPAVQAFCVRYPAAATACVRRSVEAGRQAGGRAGGRAGKTDYTQTHIRTHARTCMFMSSSSNRTMHCLGTPVNWLIAFMLSTLDKVWFGSACVFQRFGLFATAAGSPTLLSSFTLLNSASLANSNVLIAIVKLRAKHAAMALRGPGEEQLT